MQYNAATNTLTGNGANESISISTLDPERDGVIRAEGGNDTVSGNALHGRRNELDGGTGFDLLQLNMPPTPDGFVAPPILPDSVVPSIRGAMYTRLEDGTSVFANHLSETNFFYVWTSSSVQATVEILKFERVDIRGSGQNNWFVGGDLADTLRGDGGNDYLNGNAGLDEIFGGKGDDTIAGSGAWIEGGAGNDLYIADFSGETVGMVWVGTGANWDPGGTGTNLRFRNIEHLDLKLGSGNDFIQLTRNQALNDRIDGGAGNDTIDGGLLPRIGADTLAGGEGIDVLKLNLRDLVGSPNLNVNGDFVRMRTADGGWASDISEVGRLSRGGNPNVNQVWWLSGFERVDIVGSLTHDTLIGGALDDTLIGAAGDDLLLANGGNNFIQGGAGDDRLVGRGPDVDGGAGDDRWFADYSDNSDTMVFADNRFKDNGTLDLNVRNVESFELTLGTGDDSFLLSSYPDFSDSIDGGAGNDTLGSAPIAGASGRDTLRGGEGTDLLQLDLSGTMPNPGPWNRSYTEMNDSTRGKATHLRDVVELYLQDSGDTNIYSSRIVLSDFERVDIVGSGGYDHIVGGDFDDTIKGAAGGDWLFGNAGNDQIGGGASDDILLGHAGRDTLDGGQGNDSLFGGGGNDTMLGGPGSDTLSGEAGHDRLFGGSEDDSLSGGIQNDLLSGDEGNDTLSGDSGSDTLRGGPNDDELLGGNGSDALFGGGGADLIVGGRGRDTISPQSGDDRVYLGPSADLLIIGKREGRDHVMDFTDGQDRIDLTAYSFDGFDAVKALARDANGRMVIDLTNQDKLFLYGMTRTDFDPSDVLT